MIPYSQWCHPSPGKRGDLSDETPPPSARAPIGCWDPRWSQHCSESVWRGLRTCGYERGIIGHDTGKGGDKKAHTHTHIHKPPDITYLHNSAAWHCSCNSQRVFKVRNWCKPLRKTCIRQHFGLTGLSVLQSHLQQLCGRKKMQQKMCWLLPTWECWGSHRSWCQLD